jgi:hypothetical protein
MLVHYVTSHSTENKSLFVVVHVKFGHISCVCKLERTSRLLLQGREGPFTSAMRVPSH